MERLILELPEEDREKNKTEFGIFVGVSGRIVLFNAFY